MLGRSGVASDHLSIFTAHLPVNRISFFLSIGAQAERLRAISSKVYTCLWNDDWRGWHLVLLHVLQTHTFKEKQSSLGGWRRQQQWKNVCEKQDPLLTPFRSWRGEPLYPKAKLSARHHGSAWVSECGLKLKTCCNHIPKGPAGAAQQENQVRPMMADKSFNALISGTGSYVP